MMVKKNRVKSNRLYRNQLVISYSIVVLVIGLFHPERTWALRFGQESVEVKDEDKESAEDRIKHDNLGKYEIVKNKIRSSETRYNIIVRDYAKIEADLKHAKEERDFLKSKTSKYHLGIIKKRLSPDAKEDLRRLDATIKNLENKLKSQSNIYDQARNSLDLLRTKKEWLSDRLPESKGKPAGEDEETDDEDSDDGSVCQQSQGGHPAGASTDGIRAMAQQMLEFSRKLRQQPGYTGIDFSLLEKVSQEMLKIINGGHDSRLKGRTPGGATSPEAGEAGESGEDLELTSRALFEENPTFVRDESRIGLRWSGGRAVSVEDIARYMLTNQNVEDPIVLRHVDEKGGAKGGAKTFHWTTHHDSHEQAEQGSAEDFLRAIESQGRVFQVEAPDPDLVNWIRSHPAPTKMKLQEKLKVIGAYQDLARKNEDVFQIKSNISSALVRTGGKILVQDPGSRALRTMPIEQVVDALYDQWAKMGSISAAVDPAGSNLAGLEIDKLIFSKMNKAGLNQPKQVAEGINKLNSSLKEHLIRQLDPSTGLPVDLEITVEGKNSTHQKLQVKVVENGVEGHFLVDNGQLTRFVNEKVSEAQSGGDAFQVIGLDEQSKSLTLNKNGARAIKLSNGDMVDLTDGADQFLKNLNVVNLSNLNRVLIQRYGDEAPVFEEIITQAAPNGNYKYRMNFPDRPSAPNAGKCKSEKELNDLLSEFHRRWFGKVSDQRRERAVLNLAPEQKWAKDLADAYGKKNKPEDAAAPFLRYLFDGDSYKFRDLKNWPFDAQKLLSRRDPSVLASPTTMEEAALKQKIHDVLKEPGKAELLGQILVATILKDKEWHQKTDIRKLFSENLSDDNQVNFSDELRRRLISDTLAGAIRGEIAKHADAAAVIARLEQTFYVSDTAKKLIAGFDGETSKENIAAVIRSLKPKSVAGANFEIRSPLSKDIHVGLLYIPRGSTNTKPLKLNFDKSSPFEERVSLELALAQAEQTFGAKVVGATIGQTAEDAVVQTIKLENGFEVKLELFKADEGYRYQLERVSAPFGESRSLDAKIELDDNDRFSDIVFYGTHTTQLPQDFSLSSDELKQLIAFVNKKDTQFVELQSIERVSGGSIKINYLKGSVPKSPSTGAVPLTGMPSGGSTPLTSAEHKFSP